MSLNDRVEFPAYNICVDKGVHTLNLQRTTVYVDQQVLRELAVRRKVVVAIRGTLSVQDCMTDCIADDESLDELGLEGEFAHDGMYKSAQNIKDDLAEHNLLSLLLNDGQIPAGGAKDFVALLCSCC